MEGKNQKQNLPTQTGTGEREDSIITQMDKLPTGVEDYHHIKHDLFITILNIAKAEGKKEMLGEVRKVVNNSMWYVFPDDSKSRVVPVDVIFKKLSDLENDLENNLSNTGK